MTKKSTEDGLTADELGNQHGFVCPKCDEGDQLAIWAMVRSELLPDGVNWNGDTEWDDDNHAECGCGWTGTVKDLRVIELDD
jgi:hypothetical protein